MNPREYAELSPPGLAKDDRHKKAREDDRAEKDKVAKDRHTEFDRKQHEQFSGKFPSWRKKELLDLLKGQSYYQDGNKVVVTTGTPGIRMELKPSGDGYNATIKNSRGAVKGELTSCNSVGDLKGFMMKNEVSSPSLFSKKGSRLENPHEHKRLAREV